MCECGSTPLYPLAPTSTLFMWFLNISVLHAPPLLRIEVASNIHAQLADLLSIFEKLYFTILVLKTVTLFWYHFS